MYREKSFLAVIPAKGISRGLRNKNTKLFAGKPLIEWSIDAAKESKIFDDIIVSSESEEILSIAEKCGVGHWLRPPHLSLSYALIADVMVDVLKGYEHFRNIYDYVQLIQCTSPLLTPAQIRGAADWIINKNADMVIGVSPVQDASLIVKPIPLNWDMRGWYPDEYKDKNRQDFEQAYKLNGNIYLAKWEVWAERKDWWETKIFGFPMDTYYDVDIDNIHDFYAAEERLKRKHYDKNQPLSSYLQ